MTIPGLPIKCRVDVSEAPVANDPVNHPKHYTKGGIETLDFIKAKLTQEEFQGYLKGNIMKYITREKFKGGFEDLRKARFYLDRLIETEPKHE